MYYLGRLFEWICFQKSVKSSSKKYSGQSPQTVAIHSLCCVAALRNRGTVDECVYMDKIYAYQESISIKENEVEVELHRSWEQDRVEWER